MKLTKSIDKVDSGDEQGSRVSAIQKKTQDFLNAIGGVTYYVKLTVQCFQVVPEHGAVTGIVRLIAVPCDDRSVFADGFFDVPDAAAMLFPGLFAESGLRVCRALEHPAVFLCPEPALPGFYNGLL